jgi:hypothetical protein
MTPVPPTANDDLERLRALLRDISSAARIIWDKAPNVGPLCVSIQQLSQSAFTVLADIEAQDADRNVAHLEDRRLRS